MATVTELQAEIARLRERYRIAQNGLATLNKSLQSNQEILARYTAEVSSIPGQIALLETQINANQPPPPATASQTAGDDAPKGPNAPPQAQVGDNGRIVPPPDTTTPTNAIPPATSDTTGATTGTNAPVRTTEQTQATGTGYNGDGNAVGLDVRAEDGTLSNLRKNPETGELYDPGGMPGGVDLKTKPGVSAPSEDSGKKSATTTQTDVNAANSSVLNIIPQPNILDQFYSYTYSASVYLMTPDQYIRVLSGESRKVDGYQLLFQSGGAPVSNGVIRPSPTDNTSVDAAKYAETGRNPFFTNDYYIDNIVLETIPMGKGTGAAHMSTGLKFTVVEPNGITLLDNLYKAVQNFAPKDGSGAINYTAAIYMMAIRFYGYDQSGNIQYPIRGGLETAQATSDSKAVIEKFIPFSVAKINWSIGTKLVSYEWEGVPIGQLQAGYTARGTIPYDMQLVDTTVGGLLGGDALYATAQAPPAKPGQATTTGNQSDANQSDAETRRLAGRNAAAAPAASAAAPAPPTADAATSAKKVSQGLMGAMNDFQRELVKKGTFDVPDEYFIKFVDGFNVKGIDISGAKIELPTKKVDHAGTAAGQPGTKDVQALDPTKQYTDMISRSFSITAGQQLLQAIELAIRNSSYVLSQANVVKNDDGTEEMKSNPGKQLNWFTIIMEAQPIKYDFKRNDNAYRMTYIIAPYIPKNVNSIYFPISRFSGVHKSYPFWFTGNNTAVKEYQENLNSLYTLSLTGNTPKNSAAQKIAQGFSSSMQEIPKYAFASASGESRSGAKGAELEAAANAAEVLYDPGSMAETKVKIIGDPAWIMQGSLFKSVKPGTFSNNTVRTGFEPDGSISFDSQDVLFEMAWQRPEDYDLNTGLADPYSGGYSGNAIKSRAPLQSRVYMCTKVVSEFKGGSFDQQLTGILYMFPKPDKKNVADPAVATAATQAAADTNRPAATGKPVTTPNQTAATGNRIGLELTGRIQNNALTDPRSTLNSNGDTAGILGAQNNRGGTIQEAVTNLPNTSDGAGVGSGTATQNANLNIQPANPPTPVTSDGQIVSSDTTPSGPPKLPSVPTGQNKLSDAQILEEIANAKADAQARLQKQLMVNQANRNAPQQINKD